MEDTVFSDEDSEVTMVTAAAAKYVGVLPNSLSACFSYLSDSWAILKVVSKFSLNYVKG